MSDLSVDNRGRSGVRADMGRGFEGCKPLQSKKPEKKMSEGVFSLWQKILKTPIGFFPY